MWRMWRMRFLHMAKMLITTDSEQKDSANLAFNNLNYNIQKNGYNGKKVKQITSRRSATYRRWEALEEKVIDFEEEHLIVDRWEPGMPEFEAAKGQLKHREYLLALDDLEKLVVQRFLEMTKLNMNGVGE
jgi:hypothetical protein